MRLVDLNDRDLLGSQGAHEGGRVRASRLDADAVDLPVIAQPVDQSPIPVGAGREGGHAEQPTLKIKHGDVVLIRVRVDAGDNPPLIGHPSLHRPFQDRGRQGRDGRTQQ